MSSNMKNKPSFHSTKQDYFFKHLSCKNRKIKKRLQNCNLKQFVDSAKHLPVLSYKHRVEINICHTRNYSVLFPYHPLYSDQEPWHNAGSFWLMNGPASLIRFATTPYCRVSLWWRMYAWPHGLSDSLLYRTELPPPSNTRSFSGCWAMAGMGRPLSRDSSYIFPI